MKLNAVKIIAACIAFVIIWYWLAKSFIRFFSDSLTFIALEQIELVMLSSYALIFSVVIFKLIKINNKTISDTENQYQSLYRENPNPLWIYDPVSLKFVFVNDAAIAMYGYSREEFLSMTLKDIRPAEDYQKLIDSNNEIIKGNYKGGVWRHLKKNGVVIYVNITLQKVKYQQKEYIMVFAIDITERVEYEQELTLMNQRLSEEKQKLQETERLARVSGWEYFVEEDCLIWSDELYEIFEIDKASEKVDYQRVLKAIHPEDLTSYNQAIENLLKHGKDLDISYRYITLTGVTKYVKLLGKMHYSAGKMFKVQGTMQDVSELKLVQIEKSQYQQRLKSTLDNITDCYFQLDRKWIITAINSNFEKTLGIKQENLLHHHYLELFPDVKHLKFYTYFQKVFNEGIPVNFEEFSPSIKKWLCVNAYPTDEGAAIYFSDITENKEKDLQLKEALERYDLVAKATKDVIYDWDVLNDTVKYGRNLGELLEMPEEENFVGTFDWWKERIQPDDLKRIWNIYKDAIKKGQTNCGVEYRMKTSSGQYKYVYDQGYLQYGKQGELVRMIGAIKDIDQLKRFDDENKRLADIITKVNNMIIIQDVNHKITWVNKAFETFTGYSLPEVINKNPNEVIAGPETDIKVIKNITNAKKAFSRFSVEIVSYTRDKRKYWVNMEFTPLFTADGKPDGYISIHTDITQQKEKAERISRQNQILRNIAWMSSHELRRPVASILGLIELVKDTTDESEKAESIEMMDTCTKHLDEIIHQINDKIEQEITEEQEIAKVKIIL